MLLGFLTWVGLAGVQLSPSSPDLLLYMKPTDVLNTWNQELLPVLATAPSISHVG